MRTFFIVTGIIIASVMFTLLGVAQLKAEPDEPADFPTTTERIDKPIEPALVALETEEVSAFDADKADKMVVKITNLKGEFRATGFYIGKDTVVTAAHVTRDERSFTTPFGRIENPPILHEHLLVWNKDGEVALGTVKYRGKNTDFAVITLSNNELLLEAVKFADEETRRGDPIFMVGNPMGFTWSLSKGYLAHSVGALPTYDNKVRGLASFLGTKGSSGSPVFNERGELIGMATEVFGIGSGVLYMPTATFKEKVSEWLK